MRDPEPETNTVTPWEDDLETLVFDRDDVNAALQLALADLPALPPAPLARPRLEVVAGGEDDDLDQLLEDLPPAARAILEAAARPAPANAPRLPFAIAKPSLSFPSCSP